jgi:hypothetical protein
MPLAHRSARDEGDRRPPDVERRLALSKYL